MTNEKFYNCTYEDKQESKLHLPPCIKDLFSQQTNLHKLNRETFLISMKLVL